jgi:hypothetical protein
MKTIISHFYNEEYLLPWWLNHHKKYFDHGILINYFSDDNSVNIIKKICPNWQVINTVNTNFEAKLVDNEVMDIEKSIEGWRVCLNTTEFIVGDFSLLTNKENMDFYIPPFIMIDDKNTEFISPDQNRDLITQRTHGVSYKNPEFFRFKNSRKLSNYFSNYPLGRHYNSYNTEKFVILWYGFSPFGQDLIKRKLQIQKNIPNSDKEMGFGIHHFVNESDIISQFKSWQTKTVNLKDYIDKLYFTN